MEILCGQLNYNSDEVYFKCCYDGGGGGVKFGKVFGGRVLVSEWGGWLSYHGKLIIIDKRTYKIIISVTRIRDVGFSRIYM
jgi:hypothetical protein